MAYPSSLQALLSKAGPGLGAPPPTASLGAGPAPALPGLPPPPTGMGAMPTGDPSTSQKAAADQCILALRECKGHYPQLGPQLDATVDAIKAAAQPPSAPAAAAPPAAPLPDTGEPPTPPIENGSAGSM